MRILITGGAGYIGSHTSILLLEKGHEVVIADNLCNSKKTAVNRIEALSGKAVKFYECNVCDEAAVENIFKAEKIDAVIHFAALKAVGESVEKPLAYYDNNLNAILVTLKIMQKYGVNRFVFSSSATVYGDPAVVPIKEDAALSATNPYGATKLMAERIIGDCAAANPNLSAVILRYFNPVGAHKSGRLGENPNGIPNNLVPFVAQVAVGKLSKVKVFGNDYPTPDGTGVRDYIHITDLAEGHAAAIDLLRKDIPGVKIYNLGSGKGYSVLEIIQAFSKACGKELPYEVTDRRKGDIPQCYADCTKAEKELGWKAKKTLDEMCQDTWRWQEGNPDGLE